MATDPALRLVGASAVCALALLFGVLSGCSEDDAPSQEEALAGFLLTDGDVMPVFPELVPKEEYSTGENYGVAKKSELGGPSKNAIAVVVRQWSESATTTEDGARTAMASVLRFPSAADSEAAERLVLDSVSERVQFVGEARWATSDGDEGIASGVATIVRDDRLAVVQVVFAGRPDRAAMVRIAKAAESRFG